MTKLQQVTKEPAALVGSVEETRYSIQNNSSYVLKISNSAAVPNRETNTAFTVKPGQFGYPKPEVGEVVYVWLISGVGEIAYEEVS